MSIRHAGMVGLGAVTGYGWGRDALWRGLVSGKPAAALVGGYGRTDDEAGWVVRVPDDGDETEGPTRFIRAMRAAVREAVDDAYARGWRPGAKVGLLHAVVLGDPELWRTFMPAEANQLRIRDYLALVPSTPISVLMQEYGFHGPAMNVSAMCTSGSAGLLTAKMWLDAGIVDDVVFVTTDLSATPHIVRQFVRLGVAITDAEPLAACRPFQAGSRGFTFGEASIGYVLSKRSGDPYTNVLGGAMSHDGFHVTSVDPALTNVIGCYVDALRNANVDPSEVAYFNAHGPGTAQCDGAEATAVEALFPSTTRMFSVKPLAGHCQAAAASVEIAATALSHDRGIIPAAPKVAAGHPQLLDGATPCVDGITVKSSLGMGGHNAAVVLAPGR
ncbi:beta-ketoacyl synthase N-terminal-like domain-containing protein [Antrihabitans sp. YC2-6]|uniref:beta-ketoacyl synthase N-terminal-like domain-containing protein n=1 Tax=Antrihabitans sp. YC2-6 TaxID=2799498 RepID=UPI0018F71CD1|nr:beta-ketoacyl synthase N-terminal-like domain-containing protein [Antrihabitans sp. YC2-6]MBJ8345096.1 3-oxoacyl-ACP synthase [Antrihabitans sp. YC2-6]